MSIDNFGPAFPVLPESAERLGCVFTHEDVGLTKRDWFAGQVLNGLLAGGWSAVTKPETIEKIAYVAYCTADAMLAERLKGGASC